MNYGGLGSCQHPPRNVSSWHAASTDDIEMLALMRMGSLQRWNPWTPSRSCVAQTRKESNGDKQNFTFPIRHQCSVQADGESGTVARALHEINMLLKSSSTGLPRTSAPLSDSYLKQFLYSLKPAECPHPSITDLTDAKTPKSKTLAKNACMPTRDCNAVVIAYESGSCAYVLASVMQYATPIDCATKPTMLT